MIQYKPVFDLKETFQKDSNIAILQNVAHIELAPGAMYELLQSGQV